MSNEKLDLYRAAAAGIAAKENPTTAEMFIPGMVEMIEELSAPAMTFLNNGQAILTIHNDGRIVLADHAQPTEAAAQCLDILSENIQTLIETSRQAAFNAGLERAAVIAEDMEVSALGPYSLRTALVTAIRAEKESGYDA